MVAIQTPAILLQQVLICLSGYPYMTLDQDEEVKRCSPN